MGLSSEKKVGLLCEKSWLVNRRRLNQCERDCMREIVIIIIGLFKNIQAWQPEAELCLKLQSIRKYILFLKLQKNITKFKNIYLSTILKYKIFKDSNIKILSTREA